MRPIERQIMRRLHGELSAAELRDFERHLVEEPDFRARYREFERVWKALEGPPSAPLDPAFTGRLMEEARRRARGEFDRADWSWADWSWAAAPAWARTGAAMALTTGLVLGLTFAEVESKTESSLATALDESALDESVLGEDLFAEPLSLAETWLRSLEDGSFGELEPLDPGGES